MGRIIDYPETKKLKANDVFIIDGDNGSKKVSTETLTDLFKGDEITDRDSLFALLDPVIPAPMRRNLFRGKNLGSVVTSDQYNHINDGTFQGLFLGDYWEIEGRRWRIVDFDYWLGTGDIACTTHHLVIMPDAVLYFSKINDTNITTGGYAGSKMYTTNLNNAKTMVNSIFGKDNILNHREYLTNAVSNGHSSAAAWFNSTIELPNEIMMYGCYIVTPTGDGSFTPWNITVSNTQFSLMSCYNPFINIVKQGFWLRDIVGETQFANVGSSGIASYSAASSERGVRPVFGLINGYV